MPTVKLETEGADSASSITGAADQAENPDETDNTESVRAESPPLLDARPKDEGEEKETETSEPVAKRRRVLPTKKSRDQNDFPGKTNEGTRKRSRSSRSTRREMSPALEAAYEAMQEARQDHKEALRDLQKGERLLLKVHKMIADATKRKEETEEVIQQTSQNVEEMELAIPCEWNSMYEKLVEYKKQKGHCFLATRMAKKKGEDVELSSWVDEQRAKLNVATHGDNVDDIRTVRRRILDQVGFEWSTIDACWKRNYHELLAFKDQRGDCLVPSKYSDNRSLSRWVEKQRHDYKRYKRGEECGDLNEERIALLDEAGFAWALREKPDWNRRFEDLLEYRAENGDCLVPQQYEPNPQLGVWVRKQMEHYKKYESGLQSALTEERIQRLEEIGFVWQRGPRKPRKKKKQETQEIKKEEEHVQEATTNLQDAMPTKVHEYAGYHMEHYGQEGM